MIYFRYRYIKERNNDLHNKENIQNLVIQIINKKHFLKETSMRLPDLLKAAAKSQLQLILTQITTYYHK